MQMQNATYQQMHNLLHMTDASLGEKTIIGLRTLREAVRFCDPIAGRPEQLEISPALKRAVKSAHASYKEQMEREKEVN